MLLFRGNIFTKHILVYKYFSGDITYNPSNKQKQIHHKNNDITNEKYNHIDNLILLTKSEIHKIPYNKKNKNIINNTINEDKLYEKIQYIKNNKENENNKESENNKEIENNKESENNNLPLDYNINEYKNLGIIDKYDLSNFLINKNGDIWDLTLKQYKGRRNDNDKYQSYKFNIFGFN